MATKKNKLWDSRDSKDIQNSGQYSNLNLNQNYKFSDVKPFQSNSSKLNYQTNKIFGKRIAAVFR